MYLIRQNHKLEVLQKYFNPARVSIKAQFIEKNTRYINEGAVLLEKLDFEGLQPQFQAPEILESIATLNDEYGDKRDHIRDQGGIVVLYKDETTLHGALPKENCEFCDEHETELAGKRVRVNHHLAVIYTEYAVAGFSITEL